MPDPQLETLQRVTRVETKVDNIEEKLDSAINARDISVEALSSAKSAHKRLDKIDKTIFWLVTTVIGAVILAIIKVVMEGRG
ncbi:hemolysin XhlA family protein [Paenibacillus sp. FSL K6-2524]|uniref:hemolysin XhlA family protein n=1 Tax=Paenibacillus sp. FSL K6-2524 TaxID=2954516 RepID=UPI0030FBC2DB